MDEKQLWTLMAEAMQAFGPFYRDAMRQAAQDADVATTWFPLNLVRGGDPAPFTTGRFCELVPYTAPQQLADALENLAQAEMLERVGEDAYRLTGPGREAVESIFEAAHEGLDAIEPLPADEMDRLNGLLSRLVEATLEAPEPAEKWSMAYSRWTDPGADASGAARVDQYLTDLYRFRDDAHIAAWKPYGVSGPAWEALTFIWRDQAHTAEELAGALQPYRGCAAPDYQKALEELAARGWVVAEAGAYQLTEKGRQIREKAEAETDRLFHIGWSALSEGEFAQLADLLTHARERLQAATLDQIWNLAGEVAQGISLATRDVVDPLIRESGLDRPGLFFTLVSTLGFEPDPVSAARLAVRGPYTNQAQYHNFLADLAEMGFLNARCGGDYVLTEKGRTAFQKLNHAFYTRLGEIPLPADLAAQAEGLLRRVVEASLKAPELLGNGCITKMHRTHPQQEYAPLARIDQHLDDLNAFRDDAHLASWRPYNVGGHAWEAFTFVWRGDVRTADELVEKLPFRGHSTPVYAGALGHLARRGWVEEMAEGYQVTEKGRTLRQEAENATNRYFFASWAGLSDAEQMQLHDLLTRLRNEIRKLAPDNAGA